MTLRERQVKEKACAVCDGIRPWGKGYRAVSKERCDACGAYGDYGFKGRPIKINFKEGK